MSPSGSAVCATGTTAWSLPTVALNVGQTVFQTTVRDGAGNSIAISMPVLYDGPLAVDDYGARSPGLDYRYAEGVWSALPSWDQPQTLVPLAVGATPCFYLTPHALSTDFTIRFTR